MSVGTHHWAPRNTTTYRGDAREHPLNGFINTRWSENTPREMAGRLRAPSPTHAQCVDRESAKSKGANAAYTGCKAGACYPQPI